MTIRAAFAFTILLFASDTAPLLAADGGKLTLVQAGQPRIVLVVAKNAADEEQKAAGELQQYIAKISGATVRRVESGADLGDDRPLFIGAAVADGSLSQQIKAQGNDPASFALVVDDKQVSIFGLSPKGTLFGAYELLEQMGVRWFMPGEIGTVIPESPTIEVPAQRTIQVPSFPARWHGGGGRRDEWTEHMRMGGPRFPSAHGINLPEDATFERHPEYYALISGKRAPRQLCVSNVGVVAGVVATTRAYFRKNPQAEWIGMGPKDGGGMCECDQCRALDAGDWDPFGNKVSFTDRYVWFFNRVLDGIKDEFPSKRLGFYAYAAYIRPPVKTKPDPRLVPAMAPITLCRVHGMNNPICPERSYYKWLIEGWGKIVPEVYERGYWFNLADPGFPFSSVHRVRDEVPAGHALGMRGWRVETLDHWGSETPSLYIAAKLLWNHYADVDALLADFYGKFFGPAAQPMGEYFTMMDAALRDADHHTGGSFNMPQFYPEKLREQGRSLLARAAGLAGDDAAKFYARRVEIFQHSFDYLDSFITMLEKRGAHEWAAAKAALDRVDELRNKLVAYEPSMVNVKASEAYMARYYRLTTEQGYERTIGGNRIVAPLADTWSFLLDPQKIGETIGYWKQHVTGGNWRALKTSGTTWSDEGLGYFKGDAWYRQSVSIPADLRGQHVSLWLGGVDEKAKVWVNGKYLGESPPKARIPKGAVFAPFELDATDAIVAGQENVVAVLVNNWEVTELGTGGIVGPAMFYAPNPDKTASSLQTVQKKPADEEGKNQLPTKKKKKR